MTDDKIVDIKSVKLTEEDKQAQEWVLAQTAAQKESGQEYHQYVLVDVIKERGQARILKNRFMMLRDEFTMNEDKNFTDDEGRKIAEQLFWMSLASETNKLK